MKKTSCFFALCIIFLSVIQSCKSKSTENLVKNPSAEMPNYDSVPKNWLALQGNWSSMEGDSIKKADAYAQEGRYFFFAGQDTLGILQQDVDVSKFASKIDAKNEEFVFSGYVQSDDQGPNSDQTRIIVSCLDAAKSKELYKYDSDTAQSRSKWTLLTNTFNAPATTRFVRIKLMAIRHQGSDNDGYFDNISLVGN